MLFTAQHALLFASTFLPIVFAQTSTDCNPLQKKCHDDPALGTTYTHDFTNGASDLFTATGSAKKIQYTADGMVLPVAESGDSPTITSNFYIFGGNVQIVMKNAPGHGIVSSLVLESDDLDEIDYEWIGSQLGNVQTNYFGKGDTSSYDRGGTSPVNDPINNFHTYGIEWTQSFIKWSIDGQVIRTLTPNQVTPDALHADLYPQTPMQIKIGSWSGGDPANQPGVITWAEGPTDYTKGPYNMTVKSISITDYSTGATKYSYGDMSGSWGSIVVSKDGTNNITNPGPISSAVPSSTLSTSVRPSSSSKTSTATDGTTTDLSGHIINGIPNSVGSYTMGGDNKGLNGTSASSTKTTTVASSTATLYSSSSASTTTSASTTSTSPSAAPSQTGGANSMRDASLGSLVIGVVAAAMML